MKRIAACLLGLSLLLLNGCTITFRQPAPLSLSDGLYQSTGDSQLAIAIDASGVKHTVHVECLIATGKSCRVIYEATHSGGVSAHQTYLPSGGNSFINPDVAVTDSGLAVVAWQNCPGNDPSTRLCSTWYARSDDILHAHVLEVETHSLSGPLVVSRGEVIYVVNEVTSGTTGSALRYCRVNPPTTPCYWASDYPDPDDGVRRTQAAAVVSSSGSLHVVWLATDGSNKFAYYNDNFGALSADMNHWLNMGAGAYLAPAMAIETDDTYLYVALATHQAPSDELSLWYCAPQDCSSSSSGGTRLVDLPAAKKWAFLGKPSITAGSDWAYGTFSAANTDHPTQADIYDFTYKAGNPAPGVNHTFPTTLANNSNACDPLIALVDNLETIGWHICGFPPTWSDIYLYDAAHGGRIIHSTNFTGYGGLDMAANGQYVGGVWNEKQGDGRIATWLVFNSYLALLPVVRK